MLKNKRILVTGGAGFIGSHLVDALIKEGPEKILILDNFFLGKKRNLINAQINFPALRTFRYDLTDYFAVKKVFEDNNIDVVFNLAVLPLPASLVSPEWGYIKNIHMTSVLCELIRSDLFKTLIHFSSSEAYGNSAGEKIKEDHNLYPQTPYAASKAASDMNVISYYNTFGINAAIIRPFNNYGPRQNECTYAGVIPLTVKRILRNENPLIYGDGKQTRDYLYVTETAKAAIDIYKEKITRGKIINVASGKETSVKEVICAICKTMGREDLEIKYECARPGDVRQHVADISLAKRLINFESKISFSDGIKKTLEWYQKNIIL